MAAPKIRSDYDQLNQIGQRFGQEGESTRQLIQSLRQNLDTLRGGDWIGPGATAFYSEMDGSVMPSLKRLAAAMDAAKQASGQVRQLMQQAEGEASGQLRRDQTGGG
ncbi:MAG: WXG100 family type VII secretion target, partial [Thermoflexales bacterium]